MGSKLNLLDSFNSSNSTGLFLDKSILPPWGEEEATVFMFFFHLLSYNSNGIS